jgi:hypothetical protein
MIKGFIAFKRKNENLKNALYTKNKMLHHSPTPVYTGH